MIDPSAQSAPPGLLASLSDSDRQRLGETLRRLMAHGSILGTDPAQADIYQWAYLHREIAEEMAALLELKLFWDHEARIVQAVPQDNSFLLRLKLDATLVLLTLWYEFDTAVRDRGETPPIRLSVERLNDSLKTKFEPLRRHLPSPTRLREILGVAQRKNLLRFAPSTDAAESMIEVLPTLKRVIPFQDIADWNRQAARHLASATATLASDVHAVHGIHAVHEAHDTMDETFDEEAQ